MSRRRAALLLAAAAGWAAAVRADPPRLRWQLSPGAVVGVLNAVAAGPAGDAWAGGSYRPGAAGTPAQAFLTRYSAGGLALWTVTAGGNGTTSYRDAIRAVAVAPVGGTVYDVVAGGSITSSTTTGDGTPDAWLGRYDPNGTPRWQLFRSGPAGAADAIDAVAVSPGGTIFVAGRQGVTAGNTDAWVAAFDPNGNLLCESFANGVPGRDDAALAIALDASGSLYVAGFRATATGGGDLWLAKYEPQACQLTTFANGAGWSLTVNGIAGTTDWGASVAVLPGGDVVVLGAVTEVAALPHTNVWLGRFAGGTPYAEGTLLWARSIDGGEQDDDLPGGIAWDTSTGALYVDGALDRVNSTFKDIWTVRLDPATGATGWEVFTADLAVADDVGRAVATNGTGKVWIAGYRTNGAGDPVPFLAQYDDAPFPAAGGPVSTVTFPHAVPNPFRPGSGGPQDAPAITFTTLPPGAALRVYTLAGGLVADLTDADGDGVIVWNTLNLAGTDTASGVYVFVVRAPGGGITRGKVVIIR